jgi:gamma-butyrobetaine dioxygenase
MASMVSYSLFLWLHLCIMASATPLESNTVSVNIRGVEKELHTFWLRERCTESFYLDQSTLQPLYDIHQEDGDLHVTQATTSSDSLFVSFSDDTNCTIPMDRVEAEVQQQRNLTIQAGLISWPENILWEKELIHPPVFSYDDVMKGLEKGEGEIPLRFLKQLLPLGIVILKDAPQREGVCTEFSSLVSTPRSTEWGEIFNVRTVPDQRSGDKNQPSTIKKDLAYTSSAINLHTDNPYRDPVPDYQILHAIEHCTHDPPHSECSVTNVFVDGFKVADDLRKEDPEAFRLLSQVKVRFENNGGDNSTATINFKPVIELRSEDGYLEAGQPAAIHFSAKSGGYAPFLDPVTLEQFYKAKRKFSHMLHSEKYAIRLKLFPGAMAVFDNKRILHARTNVAPTDGKRWLQGCYMNRDGLWVTFERESRRLRELSEAPAWTGLWETTRADIERMGVEYTQKVDRRMIEIAKDLLKKQQEDMLGMPLTLYQHGLQAASRALRANASDEVVVATLLHDVFETTVTKTHGEMAAAFLAPWISPRMHWILAHHEVFQGYYYYGKLGMDENLREMFIDSPYFDATVEWCEKYDAVAFDADYPILPLSAFDGPLEKVFALPQFWWNPSHPKAGAVGGQAVKTNTSAQTCSSTWSCHAIGTEPATPISASA